MSVILWISRRPRIFSSHVRLGIVGRKRDFLLTASDLWCFVRRVLLWRIHVHGRGGWSSAVQDDPLLRLY